jgi:hypothetical protein
MEKFIMNGYGAFDDVYSRYILKKKFINNEGKQCEIINNNGDMQVIDFSDERGCQMHIEFSEYTKKMSKKLESELINNKIQVFKNENLLSKLYKGFKTAFID